MKVLYFAWIRERVGKSAEEISCPGDVVTVADLIAWLRSRGDEYDHALSCGDMIRASLDRSHVRHDAVLAGAQEIALFPPMTGG